MNLDEFYQKYPKEKVDDALAFLNYKTAPKDLPKSESDTKPTLYIFRHGQTEDNAEQLFSGWRDSPLTEKGREQSRILAEKLKDKKIDMLISSPQIRAVETMKVAMSKNKAKDLEIHMDERIKERSYGNLQGKSKLELQLSNPDYAKKVRRSFDEIPPNGESISMVCDRVFQFCDEIIPLMKQNNINIAVSCHGNSIRGFRKYFEGLNPEETSSIETPLGQDYIAYLIN
jgi:2,3-bisphosphoglycerate-dependent phosphoglycerate mutase